MLKDKIDEKILEYLRNDSRESFVEIGKKLKLSESAVRRRVKNLVDRKVIERFTIEMGEMNSTSAIVLISVDSTTDTSKVSSRLTKLNAVDSIKYAKLLYTDAAFFRIDPSIICTLLFIQLKTVA